MADATATVSDRDLADLYSFRAIGSSPAEVTKKIADLERDNQKQRGEIDGLKEKAKGLPAEGAVVIPPGEEATAYAEWKALDLTPADVAKMKTDNATLAAEKARRDRQDILAAASPTEGWNENAPKALLKLAGFDAVELTAGEVTVERMSGGKKENVKAPTAFVTVDGKPVRISEWLSKEAPEFVTLLTAQANGNGNGTGGGGITVPEQRGASSSDRKVTDEDVRKSAERTVDYTL